MGLPHVLRRAFLRGKTTTDNRVDAAVMHYLSYRPLLIVAWHPSHNCLTACGVNSCIQGADRRRLRGDLRRVTCGGSPLSALRKSALPGVKNDMYNPWIGELDDVAFWNRDLTDAEVAQVYAIREVVAAPVAGPSLPTKPCRARVGGEGMAQWAPCAVPEIRVLTIDASLTAQR